MFDRAAATGLMIADDMDTILNQGYDNYLHDILVYGFKGYDNFSDEELIIELNERGIDLGDYDGNP